MFFPAALRPAVHRFALLAGLLLAATPTLLAGPPRRYALPTESPETPVALLSAGHTTYLVTEHSVFRREGRRFVRHYQSAAPIRCALATDTALWLGTRQGLQQLRLRTWQPQTLPATEAAAQAPITALFRDAAGTTWATADGYGAYTLHAGRLESQLNVPTLNAGLATADSAVWLGTNIGLYRQHRGQWTRYNEEGVANHEIPDNIVEQLLLDNGGNLWVLMSEGISVFEAKSHAADGESHLPTVRYLGRPGNAVHSVAYLPGQGHVFATAMGLLLLPARPNAELMDFEPATDQRATPQVLLPLVLPGAATGPALLQVDAQRRVWVARAGEVSVWSAKAFRQATQPAPKPNASSASAAARPAGAGL